MEYAEKRRYFLNYERCESNPSCESNFQKAAEGNDVRANGVWMAIERERGFKGLLKAPRASHGAVHSRE